MSIRRKKYSSIVPRPRDESRDPVVTERDMSRHVVPVWRDALYEHIARRVLNHHPIGHIADQLGYDRAEVRNMVKSPEFLAIYERIKQELYGKVDELMHDQRADITERVTAALPVALTSMFHMMQNARSERARFMAAAHVLGMAGHSPIEKKLVADIPSAKLDPSTLKQLGAAFATAVKRDNVQVVDAELVPADGGPSNAAE